MNIPDTKIATILFNFRDYCKTKEDLANTLKRLKDIGYKAVQMCDFHTQTDIPVETTRALLDQNELYCCATQENLVDYNDHFEKTVEKLGVYGCNATFLANPRLKEYFCADGVKRLADELNGIGKRLKEHGIQFGYHNHHREFERFLNKTMLEELIDNTDPEYVCFELDLCWVQRGGGSPVKWINKLAGRMPVVHFKDFSIVDSELVASEVGEGNLDWEGILAACEDTNVRWYVVEQDFPVAERDVFESAKISYNNLLNMGVK